MKKILLKGIGSIMITAGLGGFLYCSYLVGIFLWNWHNGFGVFVAAVGLFLAGLAFYEGGKDD